jgi:hypothetical protein
MGVTVGTVMNYLYNQVGEGNIRRSDILMTIDAETRQAAEDAGKGCASLSRWEIQRTLRCSYPAVDVDEAVAYLKLRKPEVYLGDMYWYLYQLEGFLHVHIKHTLVRSYGDEWWRRGVPENIRADCAAALERDPEPAAEPYCYTTLTHLKEVFDKRWPLFSRLLPPRAASDKSRFLSGLTKLNQIRNRVMHAAKGIHPNEDDFRVLKEFYDFVDIGNWVTEEED